MLRALRSELHALITELRTAHTDSSSGSEDEHYRILPLVVRVNTHNSMWCQSFTNPIPLFDQNAERPQGSHLHRVCALVLIVFVLGHRSKFDLPVHNVISAGGLCHVMC